MEELIVILAVAAVFLIIEFQFRSNKSKKSLISHIRESWGKPPANQYDANDYESFSRLFKVYESKQSTHVIDDITWNDLEMDRLFSRMNRTLTSMGDQVLYSLLRTPLYKKEALENRMDAVRYWEEHPEQREQVQLKLAGVGKFKPDRLNVWMEECDYLELKDKWIYKVLTFLPFFTLPILVINLGAGVLYAIISFAVNAIYHEMTFKKIHAGIEAVTQATSLVSLGSRLDGEPLEDLKSRFNELHILVNKLEPIIKKGSIGNLMLLLTGNQAADIMVLFKMIFLMDIWSYQSSIRFLKQHREEIIALIKAVGELDATISIASYSKTLEGFCRPEILWQTDLYHPTIEADDVRHPLISDCTPNPVYAKGPTLLTGSNASGKSTYLKTVAMNTLMAHTLGLCQAARWVSEPLFPITSMALRDSVLNGESYYVAEIKSLKRILDFATGPVKCLCVVDEVLRGTNTIERIAASSRILNTLAELNTCIFAATHDVELSYILKDVFVNRHFEETITDEDITFDYRLKEGKATSRNAIRLLKLMHFEDAIIDSAEEAVACFEENKRWPILKSKGEKSC